MKTIRCWIAVTSLTAGLALASPLPLAAFGVGQYGGGQYGGGQYEGYYRQHPDLRQLIDRTQTDLRSASQLEHTGNGKQRDRYRNAQKSLSTFDRHLTKGKFDKDKLNDAIGDIQSVLDHNTLQASSRDALLSDVQNLRLARAANTK